MSADERTVIDTFGTRQRGRAKQPLLPLTYELCRDQCAGNMLHESCSTIESIVMHVLQFCLRSHQNRALEKRVGKNLFFFSLYPGASLVFLGNMYLCFAHCTNFVVSSQGRPFREE